jgi:hypothetical protein
LDKLFVFKVTSISTGTRGLADDKLQGVVWAWADEEYSGSCTQIQTSDGSSLTGFMGKATTESRSGSLANTFPKSSIVTAFLTPRLPGDLGMTKPSNQAKRKR